MIWTAHVVSEVFLIPDTRRNHLAAALVVVLSIVFETLVELATLQHGLWKYAPGLRTCQPCRCQTFYRRNRQIQVQIMWTRGSLEAATLCSFPQNSTRTCTQTRLP